MFKYDMYNAFALTGSLKFIVKFSIIFHYGKEQQ